MGQAARRTGLSPAEYLAFERASEQKHEYANGEIFAMSGCSREHSLLAGNIQRELGNALLDRACEVHTSDMRVKIASTGRYVYPDASVVCGEPVFEDAEVDTLLNPSVIVEVLSETSEAYDRGDKFAQYRRVPSIMEYVLVSQKEVRIEHFQRQPDGRWLLAILGPGMQLELESIGVVIDVDRVYRKVPLAPAASE
ncbi:Uma2 family endonuclease [Sorangium sp. So ce1024]|uniref:Uma2 family endonuclease n=1 Tax=Sorangium sp. So ce1024 TaxID=3133327 RepID=UPI003F12498A